MSKRIILLLLISVLFSASQTEAAFLQQNDKEKLAAQVQQILQQRLSTSQVSTPLLYETKKEEKPDLTLMKELSQEIGDIRTRLYTDFNRHYVQEKGRNFKFNAPKGLYTKYKDMLVDTENKDFCETLSNFYAGMQHEQSKMDGLLNKLGPELVNCLKIVDKSKISRVKLTKLLADWFVVAADQHEKEREIPFNNFIEKMERLDALFETSRQIFMAVLRVQNPMRRATRS